MLVWHACGAEPIFVYAVCMQYGCIVCAACMQYGCTYIVCAGVHVCSMYAVQQGSRYISSMYVANVLEETLYFTGLTVVCRFKC